MVSDSDTHLRKRWKGDKLKEMKAKSGNFIRRCWWVQKLRLSPYKECYLWMWVVWQWFDLWIFGYGSVFIVPARFRMGCQEWRMLWIWLGCGGIEVGSTPIYTTVKSCRCPLSFRHLDSHFLSSSSLFSFVLFYI